MAMMLIVWRKNRMSGGEGVRRRATLYARFHGSERRLILGDSLNTAMIADT
jgi:hypothetical protein